VPMIKVALLEDNTAYRKALEALIGITSDMEVVYAATNCSGLAETILHIAPDVMIMDIEMPGITGIEGVKIVREVSPSTQIFMLTVFEDEEHIFEAIKAGALGYLLKKDPPEEILNAIRKVNKGESIMNGVVARKVLEYYRKDSKKTDWLEFSLSKRETEVLELLMKGLSYKEIASQCFITMDTVFSHIRKIYSKLNVHSRAEIAARFR
jgi:DNA-binding NarL/FixJ family response regulator